MDWPWRDNGVRRWFPGACLVLLVGQLAQAQVRVPSQPPASTPKFLPNAVVQQPYMQKAPEPAGIPPWTWRLVSGQLPQGIALGPEGQLAGTPIQHGEYRFSVDVKNASTPPQTVRESYVLQVKEPLAVEWNPAPAVQGHDIAGKLEVTIHSQVPLDLTVIVVAVNEIGKAFALGYQRAVLGSGKQTIPFSASMPRGNYTVRADAIAKNASHHATYYEALQIQGRLVVTTGP